MTEPIKLPPLPEPDWYLIMSADGDNVNAELRASDEDAVNAALDMSGIAEIHQLITIENAEAYAIAAIEADRQSRGEPVKLMMEAAQHLTNWLDMDNCECDGYSHSCGKAQVELCRDRLLAAAPQIPEGYKLVPIEPTPEMLKSGWAENDVPLSARWKAMLEAAPKPKGQT